MPRKKNAPPGVTGGAFLGGESGVDLLSHTVKCNIMGAVSFHGPVRDGKGWFQDAMDTRLKGVGSGGRESWRSAGRSKSGV